MSLFFGFAGRIGRLTFFLISVSQIVIAAIWAILVFAALPDHYKSNFAENLHDKMFLVKLIIEFGLYFLPLCILSGWISIAILTKRLHDLDKSGWYQLIYWFASAVPMIGWLITLGFIIWIQFFPGTDGYNTYGPPAGQGGSDYDASPDYRSVDELAARAAGQTQPGGYAAAMAPTKAGAVRSPARQHASQPRVFGRRSGPAPLHR